MGRVATGSVSCLILGTLPLILSPSYPLATQKATKQEPAKLPTETITLKEEQGHIGGTSVTRWTIEPSGKWVHHAYTISWRGDEGKPTVVCEGKLDARKMSELNQLLMGQKFQQLPAKLGDDSPNPHRYTIEVGKHKVQLAGVPSRLGQQQSVRDNIMQAAPKKGGQQHAWVTFAEAAETIKKFCDSSR